MSFRHNVSRARAVPATDRKNRHQEFELEGETPNCKALFARRDHLLIGISPFNSRFSPEYVEALVDWGHSNFARIDILLPSEDDAARLLLASGVAPSKAARKARKEVGRHLRSAHSAVVKAGAEPSAVRVFRFSDFCRDANYLSMRARVQDAFDQSEAFRKSCLSMTRQAVDGRRNGVTDNGIASAPTHAQISQAVPYIFAEIPFYLETPTLIGVESSILAYHRPWSIGTGLFAGVFPLRVSPAQGYGVVTRSERWGRQAGARPTH